MGGKDLALAISQGHWGDTSFIRAEVHHFLALLFHLSRTVNPSQLLGDKRSHRLAIR